MFKYLFTLETIKTLLIFIFLIQISLAYATRNIADMKSIGVDERHYVLLDLTFQDKQDNSVKLRGVKK